MGGDAHARTGQDRRDISIHASRMGGDVSRVDDGAFPIISIHASRMGGDNYGPKHTHGRWNFNPRLPDGRRRPFVSGGVAIADISIHASRMGGDAILHQPSHGHGYFNPRLPDGRRLANTMRYLFDPIFQSTPPGWEATYGITVRHTKHVISIHASRMGGDVYVSRITRSSDYFNPRLPDGRRLPASVVNNAHGVFQSTPPGWEATRGTS